VSIGAERSEKIPLRSGAERRKFLRSGVCYFSCGAELRSERHLRGPRGVDRSETPRSGAKKYAAERSGGICLRSGAEFALFFAERSGTPLRSTPLHPGRHPRTLHVRKQPIIVRYEHIHLLQIESVLIHARWIMDTKYTQHHIHPPDNDIYMKQRLIWYTI